MVDRKVMDGWTILIKCRVSNPNLIFWLNQILPGLTLLSKMSARGNRGRVGDGNTYRRLDRVIDRSGYRTRSSTGSHSRRYLSVYVPGFLRSETATMYGLLTCIANNGFHKAMMIILVMNEIIPDFLK